MLFFPVADTPEDLGDHAVLAALAVHLRVGTTEQERIGVASIGLQRHPKRTRLRHVFLEQRVVPDLRQLAPRLRNLLPGPCARLCCSSWMERASAEISGGDCPFAAPRNLEIMLRNIHGSLSFSGRGARGPHYAAGHSLFSRA